MSINTGQLNLAAGTATYQDVSPDAADTTWNPATDEMVPGDTVQVTIPYTVNAEGKNLTGKLDFVKPVGSPSGPSSRRTERPITHADEDAA